MRNLLTDPLWRAEELGAPLPPSPHACSVCLPTWASVIGYEEADAAVTSQMRAGYPRFFLNPLVTQLFARAEAAAPAPGLRALMFPTPEVGAEFKAFLTARHPACRVQIGSPLGSASPVYFPEEHYATARLFWRYTGQIISSRWAETILNGWSTDDYAASEAKGAAARAAIRRQLAQLSGQPEENVFLFPSGMAAHFASHQALTAPSAPHHGKKTVQFGFPYVDSLKVQQEFGTGCHFLPGVGESDWTALEEIAANEPLAAVLCELPSNPLLETVDLPRLRALANAHGFAIAVDDTIATVVNVDAFAHADLVTTSLTKAYSGVGDVIAGCVIVSARSRWSEELKRLLAAREAAAPLFSEDAIVLEHNARAFPERVARMNANTLRVAEHLAAHPAIERVYYPAFTERAAYDALRRPNGGYGMLLSLVLKDPSATPAFYDLLQVSKGPSLGTDFTLACPYALLAHYTELDWTERCGVSRHLIRVSVGLENPDSLTRRFAEALG